MILRVQLHFKLLIYLIWYLLSMMMAT